MSIDTKLWQLIVLENLLKVIGSQSTTVLHVQLPHQYIFLDNLLVQLRNKFFIFLCILPIFLVALASILINNATLAYFLIMLFPVIPSLPVRSTCYYAASFIYTLSPKSMSLNFHCEKSCQDSINCHIEYYNSM